MCVWSRPEPSYIHDLTAPPTVRNNDNKTKQWLTVTEVEADAEPNSPDPTHAVAWVHIEFRCVSCLRVFG